MLLENIDPLRGCRPNNSAIGVRYFLKTYVNSFKGSLPWQWDHVRSRGNVKEYEIKEKRTFFMYYVLCLCYVLYVYVLCIMYYVYIMFYFVK